MVMVVVLAPTDRPLPTLSPFVTAFPCGVANACTDILSLVEVTSESSIVAITVGRTSTMAVEPLTATDINPIETVSVPVVLSALAVFDEITFTAERT